MSSLPQPYSLTATKIGAGPAGAIVKSTEIETVEAYLAAP